MQERQSNKQEMRRVTHDYDWAEIGKQKKTYKKRDETDKFM